VIKSAPETIKYGTFCQDSYNHIMEVGQVCCSGCRTTNKVVMDTRNLFL